MQVRFITPNERPEWRIVEMPEPPRVDDFVSFGAELGFRLYVLSVKWPLEDKELASLPDDLRYDVEVELRQGVPKRLRKAP